MPGVRCLACGETRWSLFGRPIEELLKPCELCGGETALERRRPGAGPARLPKERRVATQGGPPESRGGDPS